MDTFPSLLSYWYMFFVCIVIATIAMSAGIGGATFFVPFILLILKLPVRSAVAIGIFVEIFGFVAGVYNYARLRQINYGIALKVILSAFLFVVLGVILNRLVKPSVVQYIFVLALMIFATRLLLMTESLLKRAKPFDAGGVLIGALGGLFLGFISTGMGEANEYSLFVRLKMEPSRAAATSVLIVAVTATIATITQVISIVQGQGLGTIKPYVMLIVYSVLGAILGAKLGSMLITKVNRSQFRKFISILLYLVAIATLAKVLLLPE